MQSRRKRTARHHDVTAAELLEHYESGTCVDRSGRYTLLRWLVRARHISKTSDTPTHVPDAVAVAQRQTGSKHMLTSRELDQLEHCVAHTVMRTEHCVEYLNYLAHFFAWHHMVARIVRYQPLAGHTLEKGAWSFLDETNVEHALVVPDIRRSAIKIMQVLSVRAGELEVAAYASTVRSRSCSAILQLLRTPEWNARLQHTLMYCGLTDIYNAGMLDAVYFAVVDSRYQGRVAFAWCEKVLVTPGQWTQERAMPWPLIYCSHQHYVLVWQNQSSTHISALQVYMAWLDICLNMGGVIGGHYDVRKCTI